MRIVNTYRTSNNRLVAYCRDDNDKKRIMSYPRALMEIELGRPLEPYEDVHHIDGNKFNNDITNLMILNHGEHQRLHKEQEYQEYADKTMVCDVCGNPFVWTRKRQSLYYNDIKRGRHRIISCSKSCSSYYGRIKQLKKETM